eukprot:SAG31_NODE_10369_length_1147_cov_1.407443_1_plen_198_part_00
MLRPTALDGVESVCAPVAVLNITRCELCRKSNGHWAVLRKVGVESDVCQNFVKMPNPQAVLSMLSGTDADVVGSASAPKGMTTSAHPLPPESEDDLDDFFSEGSDELAVTDAEATKPAESDRARQHRGEQSRTNAASVRTANEEDTPQASHPEPNGRQPTHLAPLPPVKRSFASSCCAGIFAPHLFALAVFLETTNN